MTRTHELHASVAEWTDEATGKKCKRTIIVGSMYLSPNGNQVIKLEAAPLSRDWSGWIAVRPLPPARQPGQNIPPGMPPVPPRED